MQIAPVILEGRLVRLEPLALSHLEGLCAVGFDERIWRWNPQMPISSPAGMRAYIELALAQQSRGESLPFVTVERSTGQAVGSTRFANIDVANRRAEIGYTWITPDWQRTYVNTEAKYLMLRHAFEIWGFIRVELKTDSLNERSRHAIRRIGAKEEGILRNHMLVWNGRYRHSVYFSIVESEWSEVKAALEEKLSRPQGQ